MHIDTEDLVTSLRAAGLRVTRPRRAVCEVLAASHDEHLTASAICRRAEEVAHTTIDPSTVYRILDALAQAGVLHHVHLGHSPAIVHLSGEEDHHHLVCETCGRTEDVPMEELADLLREVEERYGFVPDGVHFALVGRCKEHHRT